MLNRAGRQELRMHQARRRYWDAVNIYLPFVGCLKWLALSQCTVSWGLLLEKVR